MIFGTTYLKFDSYHIGETIMSKIQIMVLIILHTPIFQFIRVPFVVWDDIVEGVDKLSPDHSNAIRKVGLTPPDFPTMGDLWKMQD